MHREPEGSSWCAIVSKSWSGGMIEREKERSPARAGAGHTPSDVHANTNQLEAACCRGTGLYNFQARSFTHTALNEQSILSCPALSPSKPPHGIRTRCETGARCSATLELCGGCCCGSGLAAEGLRVRLQTCERQAASGSGSGTTQRE